MRKLIMLILFISLVWGDKNLYVILDNKSNECTSESVQYLSGIYSDVFKEQNDINLLFKCSNESFSTMNDVVIYTHSSTFTEKPIDTISNSVFLMDEYSGCLPNVYSTGNPTFLYEIGIIIIFY